jgi:hypothetical protein
MILNLEVLSVPASINGRSSEDTWLLLEPSTRPRTLIAAVIDGAGARLQLPPLEAALAKQHNGLSAAAFAAACTRRSLMSQFVAEPERPLPTALLTANNALRQAITDMVGSFDPVTILSFTELAAEPDLRKVRFALPACVVTLVRLDMDSGQLIFAHAGDTSLLEVKHNGRVIRHTTDQMGQYDGRAIETAVQLQQERNLAHVKEATALPEVRAINRANGIRHNYVDEQGQTQPQLGCGVIDGLPELADYIETGTLTVNPEETAAFFLASDGLELLAPVPETADQTQARLDHTGQILLQEGLYGLYQTLLQMAENDPTFNQYPRLKHLDDATGILIKLES